VLPSKITGLLVVTYNYSCKIEVFSITLSALDDFGKTRYSQFS